MTRPPFVRTILAVALAGAAAAALAQPPAPKPATPRGPLEAEIERITRDAERIADEASSFRWHAFAGAGDFEFDVDADAPSFAFIAREFGSTREIVKNAPYQADAVNEVVQTLSDGNRIVRRTSTQVARDGYGRTRQERKGGTVYLFDPIDNRSYALNAERKTAVRIPRAPSLLAPAAPPAPPPPPAAIAPTPPAPGAAPRATERVIVKRAPDGKDAEDVRVEVIRVGRDGQAAHPLTPLPPLSLPLLPRGKGEQKSLGTREFEGVKADGTMTSHTIPAGEIGNEKPIVVTSERWFSPDLHVVVYAKTSDPRTGDTIYRLANLRRGEPPAELFKVPSDYKLRR